MDEKEFLENYNDEKYEKPSVAADINILSVFEEKTDNYRKLANKKLKILLIKRGKHPFRDMYALPGGFVRKQETVDETAYRELKEETNVDCTFLQQLRTFSTPNRDPRRWVISCAYMAFLVGEQYIVKGGDDAKEAKWFDVSLANLTNKTWKLVLQHKDERIDAILECDVKSSISEFADWKLISSNNIAFDHALIITTAIIKLRRLVLREDNSIVFKLLPKYFTLSEAQQIYEVILDKKMYPQVFRRQIRDYVEETQKYTQSAGHRPSKLYCFKSIE